MTCNRHAARCACKNIEIKLVDKPLCSGVSEALLFNACLTKLSSGNHPYHPFTTQGDPYWHHMAKDDSYLRLFPESRIALTSIHLSIAVQTVFPAGI